MVHEVKCLYLYLTASFQEISLFSERKSRDIFLKKKYNPKTAGAGTFRSFDGVLFSPRD